MGAHTGFNNGAGSHSAKLCINTNSMLALKGLHLSIIDDRWIQQTGEAKGNIEITNNKFG